MEWSTYNQIQRLCLKPTARSLAALRKILNERGALALIPNEHGIYSASQLSTSDSSGYQYAWVRDNVMVAFSEWFRGNRESAWKTLQGLQKFLQSQLPKFREISNTPVLKEDISRRPHVRFHPQMLTELPGDWANAQNDALGAMLWLRYLMANQANRDEPFKTIAAEESALYQSILKYLKSIEFWSDPDSGFWEEARKLNCSSVGAVLAGLTQILHYCRECGDSEWSDLESLTRELYDRGLPVLTKLPFESPPERKADAAVLFLIFPFSMLNDLKAQDRILSLVRARLMGSHGIRRYIGDSYYCQDYDQWFPPPERSSDFSRNMECRDALLAPGQEAQWCLFDPLLSAIYGLRYGNRDLSPEIRDQCRKLQAFHFQRSVRQLTPELRCPELYYLREGRFVPEHTPLAWTTANLLIALSLMERTAAHLASGR